MSTTIQATFDGQVFRPSIPVNLEPNTAVEMTFTTVKPEKTGEPYSFIDVALSMDLKGPPDWSENVDKYLHDEDLPGGW